MNYQSVMKYRRVVDCIAVANEVVLNTSQWQNAMLSILVLHDPCPRGEKSCKSETVICQLFLQQGNC